jgi:hypothetical protein
MQIQVHDNVKAGGMERVATNESGEEGGEARMIWMEKLWELAQWVYNNVSLSIG